MKRTRFSPAEIEQHLQNIYLFSDLGGPSSHYNAGSSSSSTGTSSDAVAQLGPVLRAINASEQQEAFLRHLREFVGGKEKEIEDVCKDNYQVRFPVSKAHLLALSPRPGTGLCNFNG